MKFGTQFPNQLCELTVQELLVLLILESKVDWTFCLASVNKKSFQDSWSCFWNWCDIHPECVPSHFLIPLYQLNEGPNGGHQGAQEGWLGFQELTSIEPKILSSGPPVTASGPKTKEGTYGCNHTFLILRRKEESYRRRILFLCALSIQKQGMLHTQNSIILPTIYLLLVYYSENKNFDQW